MGWDGFFPRGFCRGGLLKQRWSSGLPTAARGLTTICPQSPSDRLRNTLVKRLQRQRKQTHAVRDRYTFIESDVDKKRIHGVPSSNEGLLMEAEMDWKAHYDEF